ncbi:MAG: adenosylhomocysteinase [Candidatus Doudnabacteria bacterium]|nr:adenosylhomocysteinase [Candidatus Doudnabacteria bacterium]
MKYDIKSSRLAAAGSQRIQWAAREMPVLKLIRQRFSKEKPLAGLRLSACLHVTSETANLMDTLAAGGAEVMLCASNPLSTQDDVAASLVRHYSIPVFAIRGEDRKTYYRHLNQALALRPQITMDDGADLVSLLHGKKKNLAKNVFGSSEETTTGVIRLRALEKKGLLKFPVIAVNDSKTKHLFDNRYGTGQSTIDGILRATNVLLAGKTFVVAGYGYCGKGVAARARGMNAIVVVTEVDPVRALEARMDGFEVLPMGQAIKRADLLVTVTGNVNAVDVEHFRAIKDGCIVANAGHFNVELNLAGLKRLSKSVTFLKPNVEEYLLKNGRRVFVLAQGRLVNLAAAEGHPSMVMDMSFANQALAAVFIARNHARLQKKVYSVERELDEEVALLKLRSMGIVIDKLSEKQKRYLSSWQEGT